MSLINKILPKKIVDEYFLTLGIEEHRICAAIAKITDNKIEIIGHGESEWGSDENEIEAADIAISMAEKELKDDILIEKVIFGMPLTFLDQDKIIPDEQEKMKKICHELSLNPLGFIEYPQAIEYYLERKEESKPTTFLLSIGKNHLAITLIRVGRIEKNHLIKRSDNFLADFEELLKEFKEEILPSRIILYDEGDTEEMQNLKDALLDFPWSKHSSFLHTPRIEILAPTAVMTALVETVGGSILKNLEIQSEEKTTTVSTEEKTAENAPVEIENADNFGFVKEANLKTKSHEEISQKEKIEELFSQNQEIIPKKSGPGLLSVLQKVVAGFSRLNFKFNLIRFFSIPIILAIVVVVIIYAWYRYPSSMVKIIVNPETATQKVNVLFTKDTNRLEKEKNTIIIRQMTAEISGDKSVSTTGKSKVGESAKGEVVIYNKTLSSKTFPKGTVLTQGSLKFTLDQDTAIASASDTGEGLVFSKTATKITASQIGPESNLPVGSIFNFKDFPESSYYAKNSQALSGGTSREIPSVSKEDQEGLVNSLVEELIPRAKKELMNKLPTDEKVIDDILNKTIISKKFNKEIGMEARNLNLSLNLQVSSFTYNQKDLFTIVQTNPSTPMTDFIEDVKRKNITISEIKLDKRGDYTASIIITSFFTPVIDINNIKSQLTGKTFHEADSILSRNTKISGFEVINLQTFPFIGNRLPARSENIEFIVQPR